MRAVAADFQLTAGTFQLHAELSLDEGVLVLFGPSGSGKSLTISALAGIVRPSSGRIVVRGEVLFDREEGVEVPAHRRKVGYVPQHHALLPFRDVYDNVAFGLPRSERRRGNAAVLSLLDELGIRHLETSRPDVLSGGERQKVALARALAVQPRLLLLDEPFASIDRDGRMAMRRLLRETLSRHATPAVFVTHSPHEALQVGDRLVRYEPGRTVESGSPAEILASEAEIRLHGTASPDGPGTWRLDSAVLHGPPELLDGDDVDLVLRRPKGVTE